MTASKQKGTGGETELLRMMETVGFVVRRTTPGERYDLDVTVGRWPIFERAVEVLATRPDHGRWLVTVDLPDFMDMLMHSGLGAHIEVKRYKRFSLHAIYEGKFGGKK